MRKIILLCLICVCTMASAQKKQPPIQVTFYGVDFSNVTVNGATESADKFIEALKAINPLILKEAKKYDIGKYTNTQVINTNIENAVKSVDAIKNENFLNKAKEKIDCAGIVKEYTGGEGTGLLIIAQELNKSRSEGNFIYVLFNEKTGEIIKETALSGEPKGFGLRNYWAGALYNSMRNYRRQ